MNRSLFTFCIAILLLAMGMALLPTGGCDRAKSASTSQPAGIPPRVVSLVPSATDLILGMGAGEHLVGVSTFDMASRTRGLPRVGDYQTVDWEQIHKLQPQVMIIFQGLDRVPAGMSQQAKDLKIQLVNVRTETLDDIYRELQTLGDLIKEPQRASLAIQELRSRMDLIRAQVQSQPRIRTLIIVEANGQSAAGPGTFLDDLLQIAGGENVLKDTTAHWPQIDRERLQQLNPEAIIQLLPDAADQVLTANKQFWQQMPELAAVKNHRIYTITDSYVLISGYRVGDLAQSMADVLHPATPQPGANDANPIAPATTQVTPAGHNP